MNQKAKYDQEQEMNKLFIEGSGFLKVDEKIFMK